MNMFKRQPEVPIHMSGAAAIQKMRSEFLQLVTAYNAIGLYGKASNAQEVAIRLNQFLIRNKLEELAWPPEVRPGGILSAYGDTLERDDL